MNRTHRSLVRRAKKIDADEMADIGDDYLDGLKLNRRFVKGIRGLKTEQSIKNHVKNIDKYEREIIKLEEKIQRLEERKALEAAKLEEKVDNNLVILREELPENMYRDFLRQ